MKTIRFSIIITLILITTAHAQVPPQWHLPEGAKVRFGRGRIEQIAYSPDHTMLAAATYIGVWLYDVETGNELQLLATEPAAVQSIAFSPDSTKLVSSARGAPLSLWDVESGSLLRTFPAETSWSIKGVAFSPDGTIIAGNGSFGTVQLWNPDTGENIRTLKGEESWNGLQCIQFSPDGKTLATGWHDSTIRLWDVNTGTIRYTLTDHEQMVSTLTFTPNGKTLVSGSRDETIRLWDVNTGNLTNTLVGHLDEILDVAVSPHNNILIACDRCYEIRIWNLNTGEMLKRIGEREHLQIPRSIIFSADGNTFATGGHEARIYIWDVATAMKMRSFTKHTFYSSHGVFSPTENTSAIRGYAGTVLLVDTETGKLKHKFNGTSQSIKTLAYSPDGTMLATGHDDTIRLWDAQTGTALLPPMDTSGDPYRITFSRDGELVAGLFHTNSEQHIYTFETASGKQLHRIKVYTHTGHGPGLWGNQPNLEIEHSYWVRTIAFSPDGKTIASCATDKAIRFWDVDNGTHLRKIETHEYRISDIAFSPDGQTITGISFGFVHQWNVETGTELRTVPMPGETRRLSYRGLSSDSTMAAMGYDDGTVRLWDMTDITQTRVLKGHTSQINLVTFSPDGRTLASSSSDGTTLLWDITPIVPSPTIVSLSPAKVQSPAIGEHLTLSLDITEGQDVTGYQATVNYDNTALTYVDSTVGNYLQSNPYYIVGDVTEPQSSITLTATAYGEQSNGDGTLATITFEVIAQKDSTVSMSDVLLTDSLGSSTVPQIASAEILESLVLSEDVNGDGVVNISDLTFVAANLGKMGANPADVNGDGIVNIVDLALVAAAIGNNGDDAAAPALLSDLPSREDVQSWLHEARSLNLSDPDFQRGVLFLENLLKSLTPKQTALLPNYPNPFNPETWIPYHLATPSDVNISIYTSDGKLVRALKLGHQTVGIHQEHWDGKNAYGEQVASGIYFYTLRAGNYTATRKMTITK